MYFNVGSHLFLPEGDDYSKTEFDQQAEEILSEGNNLLNRLRLEQCAEAQLLTAMQQQAELPKPVPKKSPQKDSGEKKTYKEMMEELAAKR